MYVRGWIKASDGGKTVAYKLPSRYISLTINLLIRKSPFNPRHFATEVYCSVSGAIPQLLEEKLD